MIETVATSDQPGKPPAEEPSRRGYLLTAGLCLLLFAATAQRGVAWQDSGMHQWRVWTGDVRGRHGLALAHPLYIVVGQAFRLLPKAYFAAGLNFFSGLGLAIAAANLYGVVTCLSGRRLAGAAAAAMVAVCHTPWWLGTLAETYPWVVAGLTGELWLLVLLLREPDTKRLVLLAGLNGLGWSLHNLFLVALPVYLVVAVALVVRRKLRPAALGWATLAWVLGAGLYLTLIGREIATTGDVGGTIVSALVGGYGKEVLNTSLQSQYLKANAALSSLNFVNALIPLAILGWIRLGKAAGKPTARALGAITILHAIFFLRYSIPDQFMFILPTLFLIAVAAGVGWGTLLAAGDRWRRVAWVALLASLVLPPICYAAAPSLIRQMGLNVRRARQLPYRDELRYWLVPWKQDEDSAERFSRAALDQAAPNGVILADATVAYPLALVRARDGQWPDVTVTIEGHPLPAYAPDPAAFRRSLAGAPLYVVTPKPGYAPKALLRDATFDRPPGEVLFRLTEWKAPAASPALSRPRPASSPATSSPTSAPGPSPRR